jgi:hypothetical protein
VKPKKIEEKVEKHFKVNEDWISHNLKEFEKMSKKSRSSPRWSHDKFEKINRESDSESVQGVRMSPPLMAE